MVLRWVHLSVDEGSTKQESVLKVIRGLHFLADLSQKGEGKARADVRRFNDSRFAGRLRPVHPSRRACHYPHLQEPSRRFTTGVCSLEPKPRRGGLFIARRDPKTFFLFFGGAATESRACWTCPAAPPKTKRMSVGLSGAMNGSLLWSFRRGGGIQETQLPHEESRPPSRSCQKPFPGP